MWFAVRNDELGAVAVVHRDALDHHRARGWTRVSDGVADKDSFNLSQYADAPDLDAEDKAADDDKPKKTAAKKATSTSEEK